MSEMLEYAQPDSRRPSRLLLFFANVSMAYPLFFLGALYGEWFFVWYLLGHQPRMSLDDMGSSWMHMVVGIILMGLGPAICVATFLTLHFVIMGQLTRRRLAIRAAALVLAWGGMLAVICFDPGSVMNWWFD